MAKSKESTATALAKIIDLVDGYEEGERIKILRTVLAYFGDSHGSPAASSPADTTTDHPLTVPFSSERALSPKQFIMEKKPTTDVERVACLAYYLTHHKGIQHFKTIDITKLNTEAAQIRFSNPSVAVNNALGAGYIAHAGKGNKQISALGEGYVQHLPDRDAARALLAQSRARRSRANGRAKPKGVATTKSKAK